MRNKKLNIAFLTKDYNTNTVDAGFKSILSLAIELKKLGHNPILINPKGYASWWEEEANKERETIKGIPIYRLYGFKWLKIKWMYFNPATIFNLFLANPLTVKKIEKELNIKFDIIHSSSSSPVLSLNSILAKYISKNKDCKLVHTIRSESFYKGAYNKIFCNILNKTNKVIVSLQSLNDKLINNGVQKNKVKIIRSGIDLENYENTNPSHLRKFLGLKDEKVILYYGKSGENKGVDDLINAINYFSSETNIKIILLHPTVWLPKFYDLVNKNKNYNKFILIAEKINVKQFLEMADIVVLPFKTVKGTEANPFCLLESMASKTPVVTTECHELKEIVNNNDVFFAKPNNPKDLYININKLLNDTKLQNKLINNSYNKVQSFSIEGIAKDHLKMYKELKKSDQLLLNAHRLRKKYIK